MNTEEISRDKLHDNLCSVYSLSACDRYAVMVQVDTLIEQERLKQNVCIEDLRFELGKEASWCQELRKTLRETEKLATEKINYLSNILKHLLIRPEFLEDKEYRRQIEEAIVNS